MSFVVSGGNCRRGLSIDTFFLSHSIDIIILYTSRKIFIFLGIFTEEIPLVKVQMILSRQWAL